MNTAGRCAATAVAGTIAGIACGVLPCYVFPWLGADARAWCGYKSLPPHFTAQFWAGFVVASSLVALWLFRVRRGAATRARTDRLC